MFFNMELFNKDSRPGWTSLMPAPVQLPNGIIIVGLNESTEIEVGGSADLWLKKGTKTTGSLVWQPAYQPTGLGTYVAPMPWLHHDGSLRLWYYLVDISGNTVLYESKITDPSTITPTSTDTWSTPVAISTGLWPNYATSLFRPERVHTGRYIAVIEVCDGTYDASQMYVSCIYSDDDGVTWSRGPTIGEVGHLLDPARQVFERVLHEHRSAEPPTSDDLLARKA